MLYVIARIVAQPNGYADVRNALLELAQATRQEPGCHRCDLLADEARNLFVTREEWSTAADEQAHMNAAAVAPVLAAVDGALAAAPVITRLRALSLSEA
jgi:quinol monooxygenase YgiN